MTSTAPEIEGVATSLHRAELERRKPAMDKVAEVAGLTVAEHRALCERYADHFEGRRDFW